MRVGRILICDRITNKDSPSSSFVTITNKDSLLLVLVLGRRRICRFFKMDDEDEGMDTMINKLVCGEQDRIY